jgi:hypothetical protein
MRLSRGKRLGGLLLLAVCLALAAPPVLALEQRRITVALFPTENNTDLQVWQSKYYPYSVIEEKMTEYLAALFADSPMTDVVILDENGMNRWLSQPYRAEDMAFQMEIYDAVVNERRGGLGTHSKGSFYLRLKAFDAVNAERFATRVAIGRDTRYTFGPGGEKLFWIDTTITSLPVPFKDGLDLLGLTRTEEKEQRMSRPTWAQFSSTAHWQALKNAVKDAYREAMGQISIALKRNDPDGYEKGDIPFNPFAINVGRIISPTATSTRKRREYIISIGREDTVRTGDILEVVRSDTYITVDPENPVAVVPHTVGRVRPSVVGRVRVLSVQERTAVVLVVKDNRKEPIQLNDLVMKIHRPEVLEMDWESITP